MKFPLSWKLNKLGEEGKKSKYNLWTQKRRAELAGLGKGPKVNRSMNSAGTGSDGISF